MFLWQTNAPFLRLLIFPLYGFIFSHFSPLPVRMREGEEEDGQRRRKKRDIPRVNKQHKIVEMSALFRSFLPNILVSSSAFCLVLPNNGFNVFLSVCGKGRKPHCLCVCTSPQLFITPTSSTSPHPHSLP